MRPRRRALITYVAILALVFAAGTAGGFVFAHEPERDTLSVSFRGPAPESDERILGGTVVEVSGGTLVLQGAEGRLELTLPDGIAEEELQRVEELPAGARVNVGVEQTQFGFVLTGVVAAEGVE